MRRNELTIGLAVAVIALLVGFWLLVLGPKRQEASSLGDDVAQLNSQLDEAQQSAAAGKEARQSFPTDYRKLVVLGKAVPQDADQSSLLVQLQKLSDRSGVEFESIDLSDAASSGTTSTATTTPSTSTTSSSESSSSSTASSTPAAEPAAAPTEASAATLPIGAAIGPAGLPVMPYELSFVGGFFQIADFMNRVDAMVHTRHGGVVVEGRLLTVDSFTLAPVVDEASTAQAPKLTADLSVTTYLTPAEQGTTAGAFPSGPAPATSTPASTTTAPPATSTVAPTSTSP